MNLNFLVEFAISILVLLIIVFNYKKIKIVTNNKLLLFIVALVLVIINIIIKSIFGNESIAAIIINGVVYPTYICIFVYLILSRKIKP